MHQVVAYKSLKTMKNHLAQKVVSVAYGKWSFYFTRGSNCRALTGKILVFWIGGCLLEVVAYERFDCTGGGLTVQCICTMCRSIGLSLLYYCVRAMQGSLLCSL